WRLLWLQGELKQMPKLKGRLRLTLVDGLRMISPARVVSMVVSEGGTVVHCTHEKEPIEAAERFSDLAEQTQGELMTLSPVGFYATGGEQKAGHPEKIAVNMDFLTITNKRDARGSVVRVSFSEREIVVRESVEQIEKLLNGN
ncbi:hypothetical protein N9V95_00470, partial [bacterium]|nr:hypothetical protein [bacterium]